METKTKKYTFAFKVTVITAFVIMVLVNALANILPINGIATGAVSDSYANLFAPAGITFAIWGVIYLLLALYTLYQFGIFQRNAEINISLYKKVGALFILSSLVNAVWIFAWHYDFQLVGLILMFVILICLILINRLLSKADLSTKDKFLLKLPFSIYYGWITVATIANVTVYLTSIGWNRWGFREVVWTIVIMAVGALIGWFTGLINRDIPYVLVLIWAYVGIIIKHVSLTGYASEYTSVIIAASMAITLFLVDIVLIAIRGKSTGLYY